jgi:hypothetical protein
MMNNKPYAVNLWGSVPGTNDDCWTGDDYEARAEAQDAYENLTGFRAADVRAAAYIELTGPEETICRQNPAFVPPRGRDDAWLSEMAMQAGMAYGCEGYNDVMGY